MMLALNILLLVAGAAGTLAAFGGETWRKGGEPLVARINTRGWVSLGCLLIALAFGVAKETLGAARAESSAKRAARAEADLQERLDATGRELADTQEKLSDAEANLRQAMDAATEAVARTIDHPFFDSRQGTSMVRSVAGGPLKVLAGEVIEYHIIELDSGSHQDIRVRIRGPTRTHTHSLSASNGRILVAGQPFEWMEVQLQYPPDLVFSMKMAVTSSIRRRDGRGWAYAAR